MIRTNIHTYLNQNFARNKYPNIFLSKKLTRMNIRIYLYPKNDTNEYRNKYSDQKYSNIRIYSSHSVLNYICSLIYVTQVSLIPFWEWFRSEVWEILWNPIVWGVVIFSLLWKIESERFLAGVWGSGAVRRAFFSALTFLHTSLAQARFPVWPKSPPNFFSFATFSAFIVPIF